MVTYNAAATANAATGYEDPVTVTLIRGLRDNALAQHEGVTDAPYSGLMWTPFDGVNIGDGNDGEVYNSGTDGSVASVEVGSLAPEYEYRILFYAVGIVSVGTITIALNTSGGYSGNHTLATMGSTSDEVSGYVDLVRSGDASSEYCVINSGLVVHGAPASAVGHIGVSLGAATSVTGFRLVGTGNFNSGVIAMQRRLMF